MGETTMHSIPRFKRSVAVAVLSLSLPANAFAGACGFQHAFDRPDENGAQTVKVFSGNPVPTLGNERPMLFITSLKVNTDGTKISYHQDDPTARRCVNDPNAGPCAINNIRNAYRDSARPVSDFTAVRDAGYPNPRTFQVLSPDIIEKSATTGKPCLTPDGYLVSMTADVAVDGAFARVGDCDLGKWIDAMTIPALVIPKNTAAIPSQFVARGVAKRSVVVALSRSATRRVVPGIVGDLGPAKELGEASIAMNRALNGMPDTEQPKHGPDAVARFQAGRTAMLIFPGATSVLARPITPARVASAGTEALAKFGGADKLYGCIKDEIDPAF
jgi:hypothetical protein